MLAWGLFRGPFLTPTRNTGVELCPSKEDIPPNETLFRNKVFTPVTKLK